jgi:hypothetical protein
LGGRDCRTAAHSNLENFWQKVEPEEGSQIVAWVGKSRKPDSSDSHQSNARSNQDAPGAFGINNHTSRGKISRSLIFVGEKKGCPSQRVGIQKTEHFVTFIGSKGNTYELMERVQKAAEQWIAENPAYDVKSSTVAFQGTHGAIAVFFVLQIEKKR